MSGTPAAAPAPHQQPGPRQPAPQQPAGLRHAVLGAGGVGLSLAGDLARAGQRVVLVMRPSSLADYRGAVRVRSAGQGDFQVPVPAVARLDEPVDVLWIAVKQPRLAAALQSVSAAAAPALVVPLLNGIDHLPLLERDFGDRVVAGAIRIEARRTAVGEVVRDSLFTQLELARRNGSRDGLDPLVAALRTAGIRAVPGRDAQTVLWHKAVLLAPLALATLAVSGPLEQVRAEAEAGTLMLACARELCAVATALGVPDLDPDHLIRTLESLPGRTTPSLSRDPAELDAIGGSVLRAAERAGVPAPATRALLRPRTPAAPITPNDPAAPNDPITPKTPKTRTHGQTTKAGSGNA
ncbi:ketopantoate reductase family protein [Kitasatospora cineracea]|uniref:ketopantoate reductase family protein n=1 Tax=Kitasatospora cineracea TaxID=88074 RepID=UPI0033D1304E